ncbi:MAG: hypothetical protein ACFCVC_20870 [Acidimicrobiia bacterium]
MRRTFAALVALLMTIPMMASAQQADDVAEAVEFRGYYIGDGVDISVNDMENLVADYPGIGFVALADDPGDGADLFADQVLAAVEDPDTVIVLSASEVGVVTDGVYTDEQIDAALDEAFADTGDPYFEDFQELAAALTGDTPAVATTQASGGLPAGPTESPEPRVQTDSGGGLPWWIWPLGIVAVIWFLSRRGKKKRAQASSSALEAAKSEIREQMAVVANEILEFSDRPDQDRFPNALEHYRKASEMFKAAEDRMAAAATPADLESLSDDLDVARWEMAAAMAIVEGRPVPEKPEEEKPQPCFFDPTHGAGTEPAELQTSAGSRTVMVCRTDAERLRRGEKPEPRSIDVGGRRVPAPQAPRSSGGGGMDWLDAFKIIVGGMAGGTGADYSWDRGASRRRGGGGGLGDLLGGALGGAMGGGSSRRRASGGGMGLPSLPSRRGSTPSRSSSSSSSRSSSRSSDGSRSTARGRRSR